MAAPAASTSIDPYRVLKVDRDAAQEEISKSLRLLELRLHPDHNLDASDEQLAANKARRETVRKAYALIGTEAKRQEYDEKWAKAHPDKAASGQLRGPSQFQGQRRGSRPPTLTARRQQELALAAEERRLADERKRFQRDLVATPELRSFFEEIRD